jgi:hypothetical protein
MVRMNAVYAPIALSGLLVAIVAGCASPAAPPTSAPSAPSSSPTPTPDAIQAGFVVPDQCVDLVSPEVERSLAARGPATEVTPYADMPLGGPYQVGDPVGEGLETGMVTDYLRCDWGVRGSKVEVLLAAVDADTYTPWANEINYWEFGVAATLEGLTWSLDGDITDSTGQVTSNIGAADYWILRDHSMIQIQVEPGSPAALQEAIAIAADIVATTGAD